MSMIRSNLCDCSGAYILVKGTKTVPNTAPAGVAVNNTNKRDGTPLKMVPHLLIA